MDKDYFYLLDSFLIAIKHNLKDNERGVELTFIKRLINVETSLKFNYTFTDFELNSAKDKLINDGYLHETKAENLIYYSTTANGFVFIQSGGYKTNKCKKNWKHYANVAIASVSLVGVIVGIIVGAKELYQYIESSDSKKSQTKNQYPLQSKDTIKQSPAIFQNQKKDSLSIKD